ncbi:MAG: SDR family NAD(P)-dependent oxidoreductase [Alphaproteobacteria bacterium]|nr:SDR family NAD(P)-dependent oxidoreductase [Alphaproteobacteria bacterium]
MSHVLITGANRGLGLEFARQYGQDNWSVIAVCRTNQENEELKALADEYDITIEVVDLGDFNAIDQLAAKYRNQPIDILINNAAVFGPKAKADGDLRQNFGTMDYDLWSDLLRVNMMAPFKLIEAFIDNIATSDEKKIAAVSATPGSITETDPGLNAYRTTKAGLNMAMATLATELKPQGISIAIFCPGWVKTRMGTDAAPLTSDVSINGMRTLISELDIESTGQFRRFNGETIPW